MHYENYLLRQKLEHQMSDTANTKPIAAAVADMSGVPVVVSATEPAVDMSGVSVVVATAPAPAPTPAPEPAPPASAPAPPSLTKELSDAVDEIVRDLSGASSMSVGDLIRFVPRLSSLVHTLQIRGGEKRELVMAASHVLVDRVIGESGRPAAHALVDVVFPPAIAAVIDVVAGRVTFQQAATQAAVSSVSSAAANPVVVNEAGNCLSQILACLGKK